MGAFVLWNYSLLLMDHGFQPGLRNSIERSGHVCQESNWMRNLVLSTNSPVMTYMQTCYNKRSEQNKKTISIKFKYNLFFCESMSRLYWRTKPIQSFLFCSQLLFIKNPACLLLFQNTTCYNHKIHLLLILSSHTQLHLRDFLSILWGGQL